MRLKAESAIYRLTEINTDNDFQLFFYALLNFTCKQSRRNWTVLGEFAVVYACTRFFNISKFLKSRNGKCASFGWIASCIHPKICCSQYCSNRISSYFCNIARDKFLPVSIICSISCNCVTQISVFSQSNLTFKFNRFLISNAPFPALQCSVVKNTDTRIRTSRF